MTDAYKILVVGSGGREHALAWKCSEEGHDVWAAPGSDAIAREGVTCIEASLTDGAAQWVELCRHQRFDLVIIGPEQPLVDGLGDRLREAGIAVLGPSAAAARLEGSKAEAKSFMQRHGIPTARSRTVCTLEEAEVALDEFERPPVVKASGLAAGKGVVVAETFDEARRAIRDCLELDRFGDAGHELVLEERLHGQEASFFVLTDGTHKLCFAACQDHKRIHDGDRGPNTGGMGAYAPAPVVTDALRSRVLEEIVEPTLKGLRDEGRPFVGILFVGLMIAEDGAPKVIEYNVRFGDPEAQPLMFGLEENIVDHFVAAARGELADGELRCRPAATVVMASAGYPASSTKGVPIHGLETVADDEAVKVFHAGTRRRKGQWETAGGRVLGICAHGGTLEEALRRAYDATEQVSFEGAQFRRDIGARALSTSSTS
jgi:phosphoribosylamine--glycine ligase